MRNLLEFPITENEIINTLEATINELQKEQIIGGTDGFILNGIHELLKNNPDIMNQLLQSLKV